MRQAEISQWRILNAFRSEGETLIFDQFSERTGLSERTVRTYLPKLVKHRTLGYSLAEDGKTKKYTIIDRTQFRRPLEIKSEGRRGRKGQVERLRSLGLPIRWLRRRKSFPDPTDSIKMIDGLLDPLYPHTISYVSRKTGMRYNKIQETGKTMARRKSGKIKDMDRSLTKGWHHFSLRHQERSGIPRAILDAKAWADRLHEQHWKQYKAEERSTEEEWIRYKPCPNCGTWISRDPCPNCSKREGIPVSSTLGMGSRSFMKG